MYAKSPAAAPRLTVKPVTAAVAAVLGSSYAAPAALAQQAQARPPLEEIIVTASRRATTVQDVPFNIAAIGGDALERQRLTDLKDVARWVPGLTLVDQGPRAADLMTVRGLNVLSLNASEFLDNGSGDTVATYLGEIPLYLDFKMKDLERIEVLIGPQGTLYGAGTLAGAVRYIPRAPDLQTFSVDVHGATYGLAHSDGLGLDTDVVVNAPIVEGRLAFRASLSYLDDPGFIDYPFLVREPGVSDPQPDFSDPADVAANLRREEDADYEETVSGRLALLWAVSDSVEATFNYYFQDQDAGGRTINHRHAFGTGPYESGHRYLEPNDRENELLSVEVVADLGFAELTSATGLSEYNERGQRDQTDLLLNFEYGYEDFPSFAAFTREIVKEDRLNQELRLVSTGSGPWNWIAGVFYNDYELEASSEEFTPGIPEFFGIVRPDNLEFIQLTFEDLTEQALFGEVGYQITDQWQVTLGARWFDYQDDTNVGFDLPLLNGTEDQILVTFQANSAQDEGSIAKLNTSYAFTDDVTGYVTISEGYRIGGVNSVPPCLVPLPPGQNVCALPNEVLIDPDTTLNYEVGVHSSWRDGTLIFNGSLYYVEWDEIQTQSTTQNGAIPITVNGGGARSEGLELAVQALDLGFWSLGASYAYNEAELTTDAPGLVDGEDAFAGDRLSGTPEHQGSVFANYFRTLANGWDLEISYGLTFTSDVLTKVGLRNNGEVLGGFTLHSASVGMHRDNWSVALFADNLTDKFAETSVRQDSSFIREVGGFSLRRYFKNVIRPRSVGIEFRYRLGE